MTGFPEFSARLAPEEGRVRVQVSGEVDMDTGEQLIAAARSALVLGPGGNRPEQVIIDLGQVTFMDSSGLLAVLRCREIVERAGAQARVAVPGGPVARLFEAAGVTGRLDLC